ncbi:TetR/AcrR family transcriptional regulator [Paracoccus zhejiangensis]|uniref:TetR/AcrR family transcriptional regulator n=1 Tax=Paracoccus zhejiangensis TaxID=1077935 RepID=A0A2H5F175_9RHOB|nr:TetR/AcrR family transcriptional regulator [Paracoccus zhejiangensis]AUH65282.1 TetR/AcrR family transcriptional regulator [Paracoccus zhejiangensis]
MSDTTEAIMDAAEARIRAGGYTGFSFRELATDVGVKSASVHYHFPTKENLAAAVARRYKDRFLVAVEGDIDAGNDVVTAWKAGFRRALEGDGGMCLCGILGAAACALPDEVLSEARGFFEAGLAQMTARGLTTEKAAQVIATLEGAMLLANVLHSPAAFDEATAALGESHMASRDALWPENPPAA